MAGSGQALKTNRVAGGFGSGRSVGILDPVCLGTLFSLGYFGYFQVFRVYQIFWVYPKCWVLPRISGYLLHDDFWN